MKDFVTEKDASQMWCPHVRMAFDSDGDTRFNREQESHSCLGSKCMAWRWSHQAEAGPTSEPTGFCGAFGLPKYF